MVRDEYAKRASAECAVAKRYPEFARCIACVATVGVHLQSAMGCLADVVEAGLVAFKTLWAVHRRHDFFNLFRVFLS
jgi:hypothetical protein